MESLTSYIQNLFPNENESGETKEGEEIEEVELHLEFFMNSRFRLIHRTRDLDAHFLCQTWIVIKLFDGLTRIDHSLKVPNSTPLPALFCFAAFLSFEKTFCSMVSPEKKKYMIVVCSFFFHVATFFLSFPKF